LVLADAYLHESGAPTPAQRAELRAHFTEAQIVEIGTTLALVHGLAKVLIVLGLEPEQMDVTIIPSPGS
jgi:alkylhydroperoxidase family enzyme